MHSLRFSNDLSSKFFRWWIFEKTRKKRKFRIFREKLWIHLSLEIINLVIDFRDKFWYQIFDFFFSTMKFWISWKKFWTEPIVRNSRRRKNSVKIQEFYFRIPNLCIVLLFVQLDSVLFSLKQTETISSDLELSFGKISQFLRTIFKLRSLARSDSKSEYQNPWIYFTIVLKRVY